MTLSAGSKLSFYEVLGPLGAGAMGEVYRARDTKLGREVAIKVLPEHFADDAERLKRFEREAKTLASLNHPNVAQIFGVDQVDDTCFLVLELVPGESLEERLKRGPLPLDEALDVCKQIAEGLEAAHEAGVIHRDLKPANVRLTPDGKVKVLDFGLAKPAREGNKGSSADSVLSTEAGRLLGTPTYMAPEQARGKSIDKRVDIWAFGCVLYECLTAKRAFAGETLTDVLGSVLHTTPDLAALPEHTPRHVRELVQRCLVKDPRERLRDIGEARYALGHTTTDPVAAPRAEKRAWLPWATAIVLAAFAFVAGRSRDEKTVAALVRSTLQLGADVPAEESDAPLALSPDGRTLAFVGIRTGGTSCLWVRSLDSLASQPLADTEGAQYPFWSPDGRNIAFFAQGKLKRTPAAGGSVTTVCDVPDARGGTWGRDGTIVFCPAAFGALQRVSASGGMPSTITQAAEGISHRLPHFLPDGQRLLYTDTGQEPGAIMLLDLASGRSELVAREASLGLYAPPGHLLFVRGGDLTTQPFDAASGRLTGDPVLLVEDVQFNPLRCTGAITVSQEGTLVYRAASVARRLEWFDLEGRSLGAIGEPARYVGIQLAPDGERAATAVQRDDGKIDLWLYDTRRALGSKFVAGLSASGACWSPDGRRVAYSISSGAELACHVRATDGAMEDVVLTDGWATDWTRDGARIAIGRQEPSTGLDILLQRAGSAEPPTPFRATAADEFFGVFSPDGRWMAFFSDESGRQELHVAPVPGPGPSRRVSVEGAWPFAAWLDDGTLAFIDRTRQKLMLVDVRANGDTLEIGTPERAFGGRDLPSTGISIARDGKRLLALVPVGADSAQSLVLVQNWPAAIRKE